MARRPGDFFLSLTLNDFVLTLLFLVFLLCVGSVLKFASEKRACEERASAADPALVQELETRVAELRRLLDGADRTPREIGVPLHRDGAVCADSPAISAGYRSTLAALSLARRRRR